MLAVYAYRCERWTLKMPMKVEQVVSKQYKWKPLRRMLYAFLGLIERRMIGTELRLLKREVVIRRTYVTKAEKLFGGRYTVQSTPLRGNRDEEDVERAARTISGSGLR